jgi:hypothetical protein
MPPTDGRSDVKTVAFQCFAEEWDQIVAASEMDHQSVTGWIREVLLQAAARTLGRDESPRH